MALDRNTYDPVRKRRNDQKLAMGDATSTTIVAAPLLNAITQIELTLSTTGGLYTSGTALSVKLDGTTLALSTSGLKVNGKHNHVFNETPSGTVNGANVTFSLAGTPIATTLMLFKNGILQRDGAGNDYTRVTTTITFLAGNIPQTGDILLAMYMV